MCWPRKNLPHSLTARVSVAGCLGYDVLASFKFMLNTLKVVSVAGCLGYDVLVNSLSVIVFAVWGFSCWLFRL